MSSTSGAAASTPQESLGPVVAAGQAVMSAWAMAGVRTGIQVGWASGVVWAAGKVPWLPLPHDPPGWLQVAAGALVAGAVAAGIRWLEARSRGTWWGRAGTRIGRALMLGMVQQPTYSARGRGPQSPPVPGGRAPQVVPFDC